MNVIYLNFRNTKTEKKAVLNISPYGSVSRYHFLGTKILFLSKLKKHTALEDQK